jgi:OMF family outer membrane factor
MKRFALTVFAVSCLVRPLPAEGPLVLSLDRAVELALAQSVSLRTSALSLAAAASQAENLWTQIFPNISIGGGVTYGSSAFPDPAFALSWNADITASLTLTPALPGQMRAITLAYRSRLLNYENARSQLAVAVAKSYWQLVRDLRNLDNLRGSLDLALRQYERNRTLFSNGGASQITYLRSQLSAEEARLNLSRGEAAYAANLASFLVSLGLDQNTGVIFESTMEIEKIDLDPEALIAEFLPRRPDMVAQRQNIRSLEISAGNTALQQRLPVTVSLSAGIGGAGSDTAAGGRPASAWDTTMPLTGKVAVSIPLSPWLPGTQSNQAIRTARDNVESARLSLQDAESQAKLKIRTLCQDLRNSWTAVEIARLNAQIAQRAFELSEQGFRNGAVSSVDLESVRNSLDTARQNLLTVEYSYLSTTLDLLASLNTDIVTLRSLQ